MTDGSSPLKPGDSACRELSSGERPLRRLLAGRGYDGGADPSGGPEGFPSAFRNTLLGGIGDMPGNVRSHGFGGEC
jgi:hypothetical protein